MPALGRERAESQLSRNSPAGVVGRDQTASTRSEVRSPSTSSCAIGEVCKILQVPTQPASNKILRVATDVVAKCRRLLMGRLQGEEGTAACTGYEADFRCRWLEQVASGGLLSVSKP
jgi:hypothetical protein